MTVYDHTIGNRFSHKGFRGAGFRRGNRESGGETEPAPQNIRKTLQLKVSLYFLPGFKKLLLFKGSRKISLRAVKHV